MTHRVDDALVEKVARAIALHHGVDPTWDEKPECDKEHWRSYARAALEAAQPRTADELAEIIRNWLDGDDATHWGDFEKALDAALANQGKAQDDGHSSQN
jgi:phage shock protein A